MALLVLRGISFDIMITLVLFGLVKLSWERIDKAWPLPICLNTSLKKSFYKLLRSNIACSQYDILQA